MEPKLDLLLIGVGELSFWSTQSLISLRKRLSNIGVKVEILSTKTAVATYNFMVSDYRVVAGAFLPVRDEIEVKQLKSN